MNRSDILKTDITHLPAQGCVVIPIKMTLLYLQQQQQQHSFLTHYHLPKKQSSCFTSFLRRKIACMNQYACINPDK